MVKPLALVVDDDRSALQGVSIFVECAGYDIQTSPDGESAWSTIQADAGRAISLLVTDTQMPGMQGNELVALVREERPDIHCIINSGSRLPTHSAHAQLNKPWGMEELLKALETHAAE